MNILSSAVTRFIGANTAVIAVLAISLAAAVLLAALWTRRRTAGPMRKEPVEDCCAPETGATHSDTDDDLNRTIPAASRDVPPA
jgi:hypothetical protein